MADSAAKPRWYRLTPDRLAVVLLLIEFLVVSVTGCICIYEFWATTTPLLGLIRYIAFVVIVGGGNFFGYWVWKRQRVKDAAPAGSTAIANPSGTPVLTLQPYQFGIRSLVLLTTFIAILCSLGVYTHWVASVVVAVDVLLAVIAGRFVAKTLPRNVLVCLWATTTFCVMDYLHSGCGVSAIGDYDCLLFWPPLYIAIVWAHCNLFGNGRGRLMKWLGCILVSALLFPIYALVAIGVGLCFHVAMGFRLPIS